MLKNISEINILKIKWKKCDIMKRVVADSTFYLLFYGDINDQRSLYQILKEYDMYLGEKLRNELEEHIKNDKTFHELTNDIEEEVNFGELIKSFYEFLLDEYPNLNRKIEDAEYEDRFYLRR